MRTTHGQERRHRLGLNDQGGHDDKECKQVGSNYSSKKGLIIFARDEHGFKIMKMQEKEAYYSGGIGIRPFTLVGLTLLFLVAFVTITFPITISFDRERDLLTNTRHQWDSSSTRAKHMIKMWEDFHTRETKIKLIIQKQEELSSIRSRILHGEQVMGILESLTNTATNGHLRLGLINYNKRIRQDEENELWGLLATIDVMPHLLPLELANQTWTWKDFYPEWIDEEEVFEVPKCPLLPMPELEPNTTLDAVFAEIPCDTSSDWRRDVLRLHMQLSVAYAASKSNSSYVVLFSKCPPFPNLFTCKELVKKRGYVWLYKLDHPTLEKKVALPVGSCELAIPLKEQSLQEMRMQGAQRGGEDGGHDDEMRRREAYATILHSAAEGYVCGAIALGHSIRKTGSTRDMVILVDNNANMQAEQRHGLEAAGWRVLSIERIRNPHALPASYNEWNYSKLRLWQLTSYHKLIFLDSDTLVLQNIDFLFNSQELSASGNSRTVFNSGVMVIEPNNCTFNLLMSLVDSVISYNGGDQGFLNEIFTWWHRLPRRMNFLKHFHTNSQEEFEEKTRLFGMDPPLLYVLHFLGYKPWSCFRDYDCSWNFPELRKFASDVAHATWWSVYDSMPPQLQKFCSLTQNQTDILSYDIATSKLLSDPDPHRHWQWNISDPRFLYPS